MSYCRLMMFGLAHDLKEITSSFLVVWQMNKSSFAVYATAFSTCFTVKQCGIIASWWSSNLVDMYDLEKSELFTLF